MERIIITGGCGFIGSNLAVSLSELGYEVTCFDNLSRRGSELLLERLLEHHCSFRHGDIRNQEDFSRLKAEFDIMIECSAEPSVLVGSDGSDARYLIDNNLVGSINCLEFCRERSIPIIFLSTSRVYPYDRINQLSFSENDTRFLYRDSKAGVSEKGISIDFDLTGYRSLYGATKLCSEYLLREYCHNYGIHGIINRCGVVAGPWQLGKIDQGVFTYWIAKHYFKEELSYVGFGGKGKQVRDLLHIDDLSALVSRQIAAISVYNGAIFNVGGSAYANLSLRETTSICRELTGNTLEISSVSDTRPADVKWFVTDNGDTEQEFSWKPAKSAPVILEDIFNWLRKHETLFKRILKG